jgi:hypothetical protein
LTIMLRRLPPNGPTIPLGVPPCYLGPNTNGTAYRYCVDFGGLHHPDAVCDPG